MLTPSDLSPPQNQSYRDMLKKKVMCISSDCGYGKSICGLSAFVVLLKKYPKSKMLIVCTPQGVENTWRGEHLEWSHTKHLRVTALNCTPVKRLKLIKEEADIYVISYNSLKWLMDNNKGKSKIKFNFVFADEADCLKGPTSKWRSHLIGCAPKAEYRILSSATPKAREEDDYWGLCKYMDNGKSLRAKTVGDFRAKYCKSFVLNNRQIWRINPTMIDKLENRIEHLFIRYSLSEKANIPIKTITCYASLSESSMKKYNKLQEEQCVNSIVYDDDGYRDNDKSLDAMTLSGKLSQLSNGFLYVDDNLRITPEMLAETTNVKSLINQSKRRYAVDVFDDRIKAFGKLIKVIHKKHGKQPVAIPYFFKHELVQLQRLLPTGVCDTDDDFQERWNNGEVDYLFLQYNRSSKSLNLQQGGYIMAFYSPTFVWVDDYQIIRRLARQGQIAPCVYAYRLYMRDTIDEIKTKKLGERFTGHSRFQKKIRQQRLQHS